MSLEHRMSDKEADMIAAKLLEYLTPRNDLQPYVETEVVWDAGIAVSVNFRTEDHEPNVKWFDITVRWTSLRNNVVASVDSMHLVKNGVPHILPIDYWVTLTKNARKSWIANHNPDIAADVYGYTCDLQEPEFWIPITRAMQLLERIELGLKHKFES